MDASVRVNKSMGNRLGDIASKSSSVMGACLLAFAALCSPASSWAEASPMTQQQAASAQEQLERAARDMIALSEKDPDLQKGNVAKARELIDLRVMPLLDKQELAKRSAGRSWRDATPEQRAKLAMLVPQLMAKTYARALFDLRGAKVEFAAPHVSDEGASVKARVTPKNGQPTQLGFAAVLGAEGQVQVRDIVIEGVSLTSAFASNFASVVAKKGIDGLLSELEAKVGR